MKKAKIIRMVTPDHLCPWGLKALDLLRRHGYDIENEHLTAMDANERYKENNDVSETPQIFIEGEHIGGYDELRENLGLRPDPKEGTTYQPVIVIFGVTLLLSLATQWAFQESLSLIRTVELFIAFSMCALGI